MSDPHPLDIDTLASVVDDVADAVIIVHEDGTIVYANRATSTLLGHEPESLVGRSYGLLVPPNARERHDEHHRHYLTDPKARPMGRGLVLSARHADGFDIDVTVALVPIRHQSTMVAAIVRELTTSQRQYARLAATNQLLTAALGGATRPEIEQLSVELTRGLVAADTTVLSDGTVLARSAHDPDAQVPDDLGLGRAIECPVATTGEPITLRATRIDAGRPFADLDQQILCEFAGAVAITLELVDARTEVATLRSIADHDRIARDLHDRVIQRLFAIAMGLESLASGATGLTRDRVAGAVDALDEVIREIRTTIFGLRTSVGPPGLRAAVAGEIDAVAHTLGFAPSLRFVGSTDEEVDASLHDAVVSVVRELLSNTARHAHARNVDVVVGSIDDAFVVIVDDDGVGLADAADPGDGLANIQRRATEFGGRFALDPRDGGGVRAEWRVPFGPAPVST